jgi:hypothetical protein
VGRTGVALIAIGGSLRSTHSRRRGRDEGRLLLSERRQVPRSDSPAGRLRALLRARNRVRPGPRAQRARRAGAAHARPAGVGGHSVAQALRERRVAERRRRRQVPGWFSAEDVVWEPWEREAAHAV